MTVAATDLVGIEKVSSLAYLNAIFDCYEQRRIAVPVEPGAEAPEGHRFSEMVRPGEGGGWFDRQLAPIHEDGPAQLSFSSGTTGTPKAIQLSHRALADVTDRLVDVMQLDGSIREYLGVPATYSFGLGRVRAVVAVGGAIFLPERGFDPMEFARMLDAGEVNALAAVPTLLRVLIQNPGLIPAATGRKLRWLEIGSQPMSADDKRAVRAMFPAARIVQHYGLTEASRSTFLVISDASDAALESVGKATGAVELRVDGEGHICIRGPHVATGLLRAHGLEPIVDGEGWLRTNDLGRIDKDGFLHFLGRADHLLNIGGIKVPAELFEERLAALIGTDAPHVAVTGRADPLRGEIVMVAHLPDVPADRLAGPARAIGTSFGLGAADVALVAVDAIPRTETGKVKRKDLSALGAVAAAPVAASGAAATADGMSPKEAEIAAIWRDALGIGSVSRTDSFFDIGGDSLSAITVALRAEQHGMPKDMMRLMFEGRTIAEIAAITEGGEEAVGAVQRSRLAILGDSINATRAILVLLVLVGHWSPFFLERMGSIGAVIGHYVEPVFHMGTPGFAMVFGLGVSFFTMPMLARSPERAKSNIRQNMITLASGIAILALLNVTEIMLVEGTLGAIWPERLFYTVVLTYFLLVPSVPLLARIVRLTPNVIVNCLSLSAVSLTILLVFQALWGNLQLDGFANLARLMLVTPYAYPQMLAVVGIGMAIGQWLRGQVDEPALAGKSLQLGLLLTLGGGILLYYTGGLWAHPRQPHNFILYAGMLLLFFSIMLRLVEARAAPLLLRLLILIGLLSFPAYVGHLVVIPIKDIGVALGLPYLPALGIGFALFFGVMGYSMLRLDRIYFPKAGPTA